MLKDHLVLHLASDEGKAMVDNGIQSEPDIGLQLDLLPLSLSISLLP